MNHCHWILFIYLFIVSLEVYQRYIGSTYSLTLLRWAGVFLCGPCLHFIFYWQICSFVLKHFEKFPSVFVKNLYRYLWISFSKGGSFHLLPKSEMELLMVLTPLTLVCGVDVRTFPSYIPHNCSACALWRVKPTGEGNSQNVRRDQGASPYTFPEGEESKFLPLAKRLVGDMWKSLVKKVPTMQQKPKRLLLPQAPGEFIGLGLQRARILCLDSL
jgi:hypothetical protein